MQYSALVPRSARCVEAIINAVASLSRISSVDVSLSAVSRGGRLQEILAREIGAFKAAETLMAFKSQ